MIKRDNFTLFRFRTLFIIITLVVWFIGANELRAQSICPEAEIKCLDNHRCESDSLKGDAKYFGCDKACSQGLRYYFTSFDTSYNYLWSVVGGKIIGDFHNDTTAILWGDLAEGVIKLTINGKNSCKDSIYHKVSISKATAYFNNTKSCLGIPNQFSNTSLQSNSYLWDFGDGFSSTEKHPSHTYSSPGEHNVKLIATTACGCSDTLVKQILIDSLQGPSISCVSPVCQNDIAVYSTLANCNFYNWNVQGGTILQGENSSEIKVKWDKWEDGKITLNVTNCSPNRCNSATEFEVPILPNSQFIKGDINPCKGETKMYTTPLIPATTYKWTLEPSNAGWIINGTSTNIKHVKWNKNLSSPAKLKVELINDFIGCSSADSLEIHVKPSFKISSPYIPCRDKPISYRGDPETNYNWKFIGGNVKELYDTSYVSIVPTEDTLTIILYTPIPGLYCKDSVVKKLPTYISPKPLSIEGPKIICPGKKYSYKVISDNFDFRYRWKIINGKIRFSQDDLVSVTWDTIGPYFLSVDQRFDTVFGCFSDSIFIETHQINDSLFSISGPDQFCGDIRNNFKVSALSNTQYNWSVNPPNLGSLISENGKETSEIGWGLTSGKALVEVKIEFCGTEIIKSKEVTILPSPKPQINGSDFCEGDSVPLSTVNPYTSYLWQLGTQVISNAPVTNIKKAGYYQVEVSDINGCKGDTGIRVFTNPNPKSSISTPDFTNYENGTPINTTIHALSGENYTYEWFKDDISYGTGATYTAIDTGAYKVLVTNSNGCTSESNIIFVTLVSGGGQPGICIIDGFPEISITRMDCNTIQFGNSGLGGSNFQWSFGDNSISNVINPVHTYDEPGYYITLLQGSYPDLDNPGQFCLAFDTALVRITIFADFSFKSICGLVDFTDLSVHITDSKIISWKWDFGDGYKSTTNHPQHKYKSPGIYTAKLTISDGVCSTSIEKKINIIDIISPEINFILGCQGSNTRFNEYLPTDSINKWKWTFGDKTFSQITKPTHSYQDSGNYIINVLVTDTNGCFSKVNKNLKIHKRPIEDTITYQDSLQFCSSGFIELTAPNGQSYKWSNGATTRNITINTSGTFTVEVLTNNNCFLNSNTINTEVFPSPINTMTGSKTTCLGNPSFLELENNDSYKYKWYRNNDLSSTKIYKNVASGSGDYHAVITDKFSGCTSYTDTISIKSIPIPKRPVLTSDKLYLCEHNNVELSVELPVEGKFYWSNHSPSPTITFSPTITVNEFGYYYGNVLDTVTGCINTSYINISRGNTPDFSLFPSGCFKKCLPVSIPGPIGRFD